MSVELRVRFEAIVTIEGSELPPEREKRIAWREIQKLVASRPTPPPVFLVLERQETD